MTEAIHTTGDEEITRTQAAKILGVGSHTVKNLPLSYRQYKPMGKALYKKAEVLAFKEKSTHHPTTTEN